ncbi:MAG: hypothetical protein GY795_06265 [Desulfobacterales bacterium]|nr:hypothetical protein [Desulfobacterales bacterium]
MFLKTENQKNPLKYGNNCQACGLSCFRALEECIRIKGTIPRLRNKNPAKAVLNETMGKIMNTPSRNNSEHYTWWVSINVSEPWILFEFI